MAENKPIGNERLQRRLQQSSASAPEANERQAAAGVQEDPTVTSPEGDPIGLDSNPSQTQTPPQQETPMESVVSPGGGDNTAARNTGQRMISTGYEGLSAENPNQDLVSAWGADFTTMSTGEKFGRSLKAGVGQSIEGLGDAFVFLESLLPGMDQFDTTLGEYLQQAGSKQMRDNKVFKDRDLSEFNWGDLANIEFWATDIAQQLPMIAEYIGIGMLTGGVGAGLMRGTLGAMARRGVIQGGVGEIMTAAKMGNLVFDSAKVIEAGSMIGAGIGNNMMTSAMQAGSAKREALELGYTEEQANALAANVFMDNSKYFMMDILEWGMTFGGIGKGFTQMMTPTARKLTGLSFGQKVYSFGIGQGTSLAKGLARGAGSGVMEMFQETYEDWVVKKNMAELEGKEFDDYWTFFGSEENKRTLGVSFASGLLMGGPAGTINAMAERQRSIEKRNEQIKRGLNEGDIKEEEKMYRQRMSMAEAIVQGNGKHLHSYIGALAASGKITEEQAQEFSNVMTRTGELLVEAQQMATDPSSGVNERGTRVLFNMLVNKEAKLQAKEVNNRNTQEALANKLKYVTDPETALRITEEYEQAANTVNEKLDFEISRIDMAVEDLVSGKVKDLSQVKGINIDSDGKITFEGKPMTEQEIKKVERDVRGMTQQEFKRYRKEAEAKGNIFSQMIEKGKERIDKLMNRNKKAPEPTKISEKMFNEPEKVRGQIEELNAQLDGAANIKINDESLTLTDNQGNTTEIQMDTDGNITANGEAITPESLTEILKNGGMDAATVSKVAGKLSEGLKKILPKSLLSKLVKNKNQETTEKTIKDRGGEKDEDGNIIPYTLDEENQKLYDENKASLENNANYQNSTDQEKREFIDSLRNSLPKEVVDNLAIDLENKIFQDSLTEEQVRQREEEKQRREEERAQRIKDNNARLDKIMNNATMKVLLNTERDGREINMAINYGYMIRKKFPNMNIVLSEKLENEYGQQQHAYALASTIFVTRNSIRQGKYLLHEVAHVAYSIHENDPVIQSFMERVMKNEKLLNQIKQLYADQAMVRVTPNQLRIGPVVYNRTENGWVVEGLNEPVDPDSNLHQILEAGAQTVVAPVGDLLLPDGVNAMDAEQYQKAYPQYTVEVLPDEEQVIWKDEMFAFTLQSMSDDVTMFFEPQEFAKLKVKGKSVWNLIQGTFASTKKVEEFMGFRPDEQTALQMLGNLNTSQGVMVGGRAARSAKSRSQLKQELTQNANEAFRQIQTNSDIRSSIEKEFGPLDQFTDLDESIENEEYILDEDGDNLDSGQIKRKVTNAVPKSILKLVNNVVRWANEGNEEVTIWKDEMMANLINIAHHPTVNDEADFVDMLNQSTAEPMQALNNYLETNHSPVMANYLKQAIYKQVSALRPTTPMQIYINSKGETIVEPTLNTREVSQLKAISKNTYDVAFANMKDNSAAGIARRNQRNDFLKEAKAFSQNINPDYEQAVGILKRFLPKSLKDQAVQMLFGNIYYNGEMVPALSAMKMALDESIEVRKGNNGGELMYWKNDPMENFFKGLLANYRNVTGQYMSADSDGNLSTTLERTNAIQEKVSQINKTLAGNDGSVKAVHEVAAAIKQKVRFGGSTKKAKLGILGDFLAAQKRLEVQPFSGVNNVNSGQSQVYKRMGGNGFLVGDILKFLVGDQNGYWQNLGVHANSRSSYHARAPKVDFVTVENGRLVQNKDPEVQRYLREYKNLKGIEGNITFQEELSEIIDILESNAEEYKKNKTLDGLFKGNKISAEGRSMIANYIMNHTINQANLSRIVHGDIESFMKNEGEVDTNVFTKRTKSAMSSMTPINRNMRLEFLPFTVEDSRVEVNGEIIDFKPMDGDTLILPEDLQRIKKQMGPAFPIGNNLKMISYAEENENPNFMQGSNEVNLIKSATFVLTDDFVKKNPQFRDLRDLMRTRSQKQRNNENYMLLAGTPDAIKVGPTLKNMGSKIKLDQNFNPAEASRLMDEAFYVNGEFVGINGGNLGISQNQDIRKRKSPVPTQSFATFLSNVQPGDPNYEMAVEIQQFAKESMMANLEEALLAEMKAAGYKEDQLRHADIRNLAKKLFEKVDKSEAGDIFKSLSDFEDVNLPYIAKDMAKLVANIFSKQGARIVSPGTVGTHTTEFGYHALDAEGRLDYTADDALKPPRVEMDENGNEVYLPGEIILPPYSKLSGIAVNDIVFVSRIPAHGLQTTVPMKVVGFTGGETMKTNWGADENVSDGNKIITNSVFAKFIGGDHDGDFLYVNSKVKNASKRSEELYNKSFDKMMEYTMRPEILEEQMAAINPEEAVTKLFGSEEAVKEARKKAQRFYSPNSPLAAKQAFEENMPASLMVGSAAVNNRTGAILRAGQIKLKKPIEVGGKVYDGFSNEPGTKGVNSTIFQSQQLLNIILDNPTHQFATIIGINPGTISAYSAAIQMGVPLADAKTLFTSEGAKAWSAVNEDRDNPYLPKASKDDMIKKAEMYIGKKMINANPMDRVNAINDMKKIAELDNIGTELFVVGRMMSLHQQVPSNPVILDKMLEDFENSMNNSEVFRNFKDIKTFPEVTRYVELAEKARSFMYQTSIYGTPAFKTAYKNILESNGGYLDTKTEAHLDEAMNTVYSSMILGDSGRNINDVHQRLSGYNSRGEKVRISLAEKILKEQEKDQENLFLQMLHVNLNEETYRGMKSGDGGSIALNFYRAHKNNLNDELITRIRKDYAKLPAELRDDIEMYDLLKTGWSGPRSMFPFFNRDKIQKVATGSKNMVTAINDRLSEEDGAKLGHKMFRYMAIMGGMPSMDNRNFKPLQNRVATITPNNYMGRKPTDIPALLENKPHYLYTRMKIDGVDHNVVLEYMPLPEQDFETILNASMNSDGSINKAKFAQAADGMVKYKYTTSPVRTQFQEKAVLAMNNPLPNTPTGARTKITPSDVEGVVKKKEQSKGRSLKTGYYQAGTDRLLKYQEYLGNIGATDNPGSVKQYREYVKTYFKYQKKADSLTVEKMDQMTESQLVAEAKKAMRDDYYGSAQYTNKINQHLVTKYLIPQQMEITGVKGYESQADIASYFKWLGANNISERFPELQGLQRKLEIEFKIYERNLDKEINEINDVTKALIKSKTKGNILKRILSYVMPTRQFYEHLYGNLINIEKGKTGMKNQTVMSLKSEKEINQLYDDGKITKEEKDFYDVFKKYTDQYGEITSREGVLKEKLEGYVPHIGADWMESFSARGLFGLYRALDPSNHNLRSVRVKGYDPISGKMVTRPLEYFEQVYDSDQFPTIQGAKNTVAYARLKARAQKLLKRGKHEDGGQISIDPMESNTLLGGDQMDRFTKSRSTKAKEFPTMDLNRALTSYVRASMFKFGNQTGDKQMGRFEGFEKLMPYIDGILKHSHLHGKTNMAELVDLMYRQKRMLGRNQEGALGKTADKIFDGLNYATLMVGLGFNYTSAVGNILAGKYDTLRYSGGKAWGVGEKRFWGFGGDKILENFAGNRKKAMNILKKAGLFDDSIFYDLSVSQQRGIKKTVEQVALMGMTLSEKWIQGVQYLGLMTEEEWNSYDENGNAIAGKSAMTDERSNEILYEVRRTHGRGYSPLDQRMLGLYSMGRTMAVFKKYLVTKYNERFGPELINLYGEPEIGSMRQFGRMAVDAFSGRYSPLEIKKYYESLPKHKQEAFKRAIRGMGMIITLTALSAFMIPGEDDDETTRKAKQQVRAKARKLISDMNMYYSTDKMSKIVTPYPYYTARRIAVSADHTMQPIREPEVKIK